MKPILDMTISRFNAFNRLHEELDRARSRRSRTAKSIEQAKGILMKSAGIPRRRPTRSCARPR